MKRILVCLLLLAMLCGCGPTAPDNGETNPPTESLLLQPTENPMLRESLTAGKAETPTLPERLTGTSVCRLKMLPLMAAVQRFAFVKVDGQLWIFATQCSKSTTYLICFLYDPETKTASSQNILTLAGYGHGESLEVLQRDGKIYVYIGSRAKHALLFPCPLTTVSTSQ